MELMAKVCKSEEMNFERLAARIFVAAGGLFWVAAVFGMDFGYQNQSFGDAAQNALLYLAAALLVFGIGWFFENLAAALLFAGAVVAVVWGVVAGWEAGVWWVMSGVLIGPMMISALLFYRAARMQRICELKV
ncbi:MAG: hypothetical protein CVT66_09035 [Actinobacteria bacterium HGW-Actinobacteria-6]|jgi:hypothetical protein|nr:MAG: hypothetical protein CVT66_09035 [Actinobacteria bacterium HGW-Actinobacteria-6]